MVKLLMLCRVKQEVMLCMGSAKEGRNKKLTKMRHRASEFFCKKTSITLLLGLRSSYGVRYGKNSLRIGNLMEKKQERISRYIRDKQMREISIGMYINVAGNCLRTIGSSRN